METGKKISLYKVEDNLPNETILAIVITGEHVTRNAGQRHAGFVVQANEKLWLYDLAYHNYIRQIELKPGYAYVDNDFLDQYSAQAIATYLSIIYHENKGNLPYSIKWDHDGKYFDENTGKYLKTEPGDGLTCATFVLEILKSYGFDLVETSTWEITEENTIWQENIIKGLKENIPSAKNDLTQQLPYVGKSPRFKPEEVLGAAGCYEETPLCYDMVSSASNQVIHELKRLGLD
ncbi:hypothetical protein ACSZNH_21980 [Aeromonas dhakensis]|uniref:hypothetical protein n=1 Tax=Aeromonas dhakensis TaxID=196024 RepID=UPI00227B16B7|nr:hypothetical protein [Aeromonas dhakensis]WAF71478.1 hypothetical protein NRK99_15905 [Aeromonas dhakensis]